VIRVTSNPEAPVNGMHLCVKGRFGFSYVHHTDRLTKPMVREYLLKGEPRPSSKERGAWVETDWDTALDLAAQKLASTRDNTDRIASVSFLLPNARTKKLPDEQVCASGDWHQ
jgi:formate dehydrogenase major subunit/formate dehydrogenase alpha subunit